MPPYKWQIFFVTGMANISSAISLSSINLVMPVMAEEFSVSMAAISWLSLMYSIIPSCTLLLFGRLADLFGYKRQFIGGFIVFGLSSLLLPLLSNGLGLLIFFRGIQGIGYAMMISITQALCNRTFPANERGMALGINAVFVSIGLAAGPSVSGLLISYFGWRSVFFFNVPFCLAGVVISAVILKKDERGSGSMRSMDWLGSLLFAVFIGLLALAVNFCADWGLASAGFLICIVVSMAALLAFVRREQYAGVPLMKLTLFRNPVFSLSTAASVCSYILQQMTTFLVPFFLINILLITERSSGFIMLANPVSMLVFSPIGGRMADRYGSRRPALAGLLVLATGCALMSMMTTAATAVSVIAALVFYGAGNGLSVSAVNASIFSAVPREDSGTASGMVATMRNLGQSMGVAFGSAIMTMQQSRYLSRAVAAGVEVPDGNGIYLLAQRDAYYFGLFIVALAIVLMSRIPKKKSGGTDREFGEEV